MKTKVINFFGGPGCSKSTTAAELFAKMKWQKINVELVSEYAKKVTWEGHTNVLQDQLYLLAKQNRSLERLRGQVEYIITDSPLLLGIYYAQPDYLPETYAKLTHELFNTYDNINILLERRKEYVPIGRSQTEDEAKVIDVEIRALLVNNNIDYISVPGIEGNSSTILEYIREQHT